MSNDWYADSVELVKGYGQPIENWPHIPTSKTCRLRLNLIKEEIGETYEAMYLDDLEGIADGIADSIVVLLGTAVSYGIDMRPIWDEVHRANMDKLSGPIREDGKRLKPKGWQPPRIRELLEEQRRG